MLKEEWSVLRLRTNNKWSRSKRIKTCTLSRKFMEYMDSNSFMGRTLGGNYVGNVVQCDFIKPGDRHLLHITPNPIRGGFPCQPISAQGDRKGMVDERFKPFYRAKACWEHYGSSKPQRYSLNVFQELWMQGTFKKRSKRLLGAWACKPTREFFNPRPSTRTRWRALMVL